MIRGMQLLAQGMKVQMDTEDVVARNLSNLRTRGYKQETPAVDSFAAAVRRAGSSAQQVSLAKEGRGVGSMGTGLDIGLVSIDFTQGVIEQTGRNLDVALDGDGFLTVRTPSGDLYSRGGALRMDAAGRLVTPEGYPVLGTNGEITLPSSEVQIERDGTITANNKPVGQLAVVEFQSGTELVKEGDELYSMASQGGAAPVTAIATTVRGGALESSNVDDASMMTRMVSLVRQYQACQRVLQAEDQLLGLATNELGRV